MLVAFNIIFINYINTLNRLFLNNEDIRGIVIYPGSYEADSEAIHLNFT